MGCCRRTHIKDSDMKRTIIITGGAGFIGNHVVRLFVNKYPDYRIINVDKLTYAGNLANLKDVEDRPNYRFVKADICDFETMHSLMETEGADGIIHLAGQLRRALAVLLHQSVGIGDQPVHILCAVTGDIVCQLLPRLLIQTGKAVYVFNPGFLRYSHSLPQPAASGPAPAAPAF